MPTITLTRQQLYDRAWTTPLDTLAKELGLSGRGLGKLCDRHDIPVPLGDGGPKRRPGIEFGKHLCRRRVRGWRRASGLPCRIEVEAEQPEEPQLHPLVAFEQQRENRIDVPDDLPLTDSLVLKTQRLLNKGKRDTGGLIPARLGGLHIRHERSTSAPLRSCDYLFPMHPLSRAPFEAGRLADVFQ